MNPSPLILIVEDERVIAFHLRQQLEALGYRVAAAVASGAEAVGKASGLRPDLVLMDVHLEGEMDGIEAAGQIYASHRIPVVFLTAYADDETLKRAQASLPFGYLVKPVETRELHACVQMALGRRAAESEAEIAAERDKERLQLALDSGGLEVWEWETQSGKLTRDGSVFDQQRTSVSEPSAIFLARVHPEDRASATVAMDQAMVSDTSMSLAFRTVLPEGAVRWMEVHVRPSKPTPDGRRRVVGVLSDITARHEAEERLRQAAAIFETTAEGIVLVDREHRILSVNPAFTAITGYRPDELSGQDPDLLLRTRRHSHQFYRRLEATSDGQWQGETYCRHKNGAVLPVLKSVSVVRDEAGAVSHYVIAFTDLSALRLAETQLHQLAHHDPLTGLPNRVLFSERLDRTLAGVAREGGRCALLFFDLDGFKVINDTLGHPIGDRLLVTTAARLTKSVRSNDTVARLGGDEFVVLLDRIARSEDAARLASKLLEALAQPVDLGENRVTVSATAGISVYPEHGDSREALLRAADTAMYSAKAAGRNRYRFYSEELAAQATERLNIEQGLRRALQTGDLRLHYQPQLRLSDGALTGVEALVRWYHPEHGVIEPSRFIPLAEESGLIEPLGRWVLFTACTDAAKWRRSDGPPLQVSVNVSPRQLGAADFADSVAEALAQSRLGASLLQIEITESCLQDLEPNRSPLTGLKAQGVRVAIDDFGTGYSSLSALRHLPIDCLKIDRSFVRDIPGDAYDEAIIETIINLSSTLGLEVVAEGVEAAVQLDVLRRLGCERGQGFLFGRPRPADDIAVLLGGGKPWSALFPPVDHGRLPLLFKLDGTER